MSLPTRHSLTFVVASAYENCRRGHGAYRLYCRVGVRALRVVIVFDAVFLGDELYPVLNRRELLYALANSVKRHAHGAGHGDSRHDILIVVHSDKARVFCCADGRFNAVFFYYYCFAAQENAALELFGGAEEYDLAARSFGKLAQNRVVVVEHAEIVFVLILGYRLFYGNIVFERLVPVEVVGSDVENSGDMGLEGDHSLKLEAAYLRDRHAVAVALERIAGVGYLDIAYEQSFFHMALHYVVGERGGRSFAVRACYAYHGALIVPVSKLYFAPNRYIVLLDGFHYRRVERYAGADHANIYARKIEARKIAEDKFNIICAYFSQAASVSKLSLPS